MHFTQRHFSQRAQRQCIAEGAKVAAFHIRARASDKEVPVAYQHQAREVSRKLLQALQSEMHGKPHKLSH